MSIPVLLSQSNIYSFPLSIPLTSYISTLRFLQCHFLLLHPFTKYIISYLDVFPLFLSFPLHCIISSLPMSSPLPCIISSLPMSSPLHCVISYLPISSPLPCVVSSLHMSSPLHCVIFFLPMFSPLPCIISSF